MIARTLHRRVFSASFLGGAIVALVMACGDDAGAPADPPPDGSSPEAGIDDVLQTDAALATDGGIEGFCQETLGLYPSRYEACCDPAAAPKKYTFDHTLLGALPIACTTAIGQSIASGRATLVPAAAATCQTNMRAAVDARTCPEVLRNPNNQPAKSLFRDAEGCSAAVVGHQALDAPCLHDYECEDGLTCVGWTRDSDGACKSPPGEGAPCGYAVPDGGFIDLLNWGFGAHPRCAPGLYCASTTQQQGTCQPTNGDGGPCDSDDECADGLRCQVGKCGTAGPAPAGAPCERSSDCQDALYCKSTDDGRVCSERAVAGSPCSSTLGSDCQGACVEPDGGGDLTCVAYCGSR